MYRLFFFLFFGVKTVMFFLCTVERYSIIKPVFLHKFKSYNKEIGKPDESWISYQQGKGNEEYQKYMEDLTEEREEVLRIWNNLNTNEQETVMSMLHGLRK